jgi:hypothetical protein
MTDHHVHPWTRPITLAHVPGRSTPAADQAVRALFDWLRQAGCRIEPAPTNDTDLLVTTNVFGQAVHRDEALLFNAKRQFKLNRRPQILTVMDVPEEEYQAWLERFAEMALTPQTDTLNEPYVGLGPQAAEVIGQQARRGGPEIAFARLVQAQMLSIRVMALRTKAGKPYRAMHFDLAGAHPVTDATDLEIFAAEAGPRVLAAVCATEVNHHVFAEPPVPAELWAEISGPEAMVRAGSTFTEYGFFTTPIYIEKVLGYRGISEAISAQYSEGCYGVYDADIPGLLTTATGSSRLVDKRAITRADQAVVIGVKPEQDGAVVRPVIGMETVVPSVEAVEMMSICEQVPGHYRANSRGERVKVPNVRAILHGHLGVASFDPERVEAVRLEPLYYTQLVSCGTGALAVATARAFARSEALRNVNDPRAVIFLEQPGHGVMVVEKWPVEGVETAPFDTIQEFLRAGHLAMTYDIAQGPVEWEPQPSPDGRTIMRRVTEPEHAF